MKIQMEQVGLRVEIEGHLATIRYQGPVPPTKGEWLGVEWDDPNRGKHDGLHEGARYFTTKYPKSGSFIRPQKASFGDSLIQALKSRYGLVEDANAGIEMEEMFVLGKGNQQTTVEVVGAQSVNKKQSQFNQLLEISVRDNAVNSGGKEGEILNTIPNVEELDLSKNLINSWDKVADITRQLLHLKILNLSENRLVFADDPESLASDFKTVETLYVNRMEYTWKEVLICCSMLTRLEHLHVCFNHITTISGPGPDLHRLKLLNLEANRLTDWDQVLTLGTLPNLETLILNNTGIDRIEFPDVQHSQVSKLFKKLHTLSVSSNKISQLSSIDELNKLENLRELNMKNNPLLQDSANSSLAITIVLAKVGRLQIYNRSDVTSIERKGAELDYLKTFGKLWRESGGHQDPAQNKPSTGFTQQHPRYQELINKYGPPEDSELKEQSTALKNSLISVDIACPLLPNKGFLKKKLPVTMTVQKLKAMLQRLLRADPFTMKISYTSKKMAGPEIEMESDQKEIGFYSVEEGDTINVIW